MTTYTQQFASDLAIAVEVFPSLNLKGVRPTVAGRFILADNDEDRQAVLNEVGGGLVRRGLRQIAIRLDREDRASDGAAFWSLRDDIMVAGNSMEHVEYGDDVVEYDLAV